MSAARRHRAQRGAALIGAVFLLVVLAALGAFAVRINLAQQHDAQLELRELRAQAALNAGIEYAAARLLASAGDNCGNLAPLNLPGNVVVTFNGCVYPPPELVNGLPVHIHRLNIVASSGVYGTPEFVSRQATGVRIFSN